MVYWENKEKKNIFLLLFCFYKLFLLLFIPSFPSALLSSPVLSCPVVMYMRGWISDSRYVCLFVFLNWELLISFGYQNAKRYYRVSSCCVCFNSFNMALFLPVWYRTVALWALAEYAHWSQWSCGLVFISLKPCS